MKIIVTGLFLLVFSQSVYSQGVQSENWIYTPDVSTILDTVNTYSSLLEETQIFSGYGYTTPGTIFGGGWSSHTWWHKSFEDYPIIPDTFKVDLRVNTQVNVFEARLGIAMQDSFYYGSDISQPFLFNGEWQTLEFETSLFKSFLNNFLKFYFCILLISEDSSYIGALVEIDNFRGIDDTLGNVMYDDFNYGASSVSLLEQNPSGFALGQNYPNPFNPSTTINYSIPEQSFVEIKLFDLLGNEIETLINEEQSSGTYELKWSTTSLPSGVYFYELKARNYLETKKMILMK